MIDETARQHLEAVLNAAREVVLQHGDESGAVDRLIFAILQSHRKAGLIGEEEEAGYFMSWHSMLIDEGVAAGIETDRTSVKGELDLGHAQANMTPMPTRDRFVSVADTDCLTSDSTFPGGAFGISVERWVRSAVVRFGTYTTSPAGSVRPSSTFHWKVSDDEGETYEITNYQVSLGSEGVVVHEVRLSPVLPSSVRILRLKAFLGQVEAVAIIVLKMA